MKHLWIAIACLCAATPSRAGDPVLVATTNDYGGTMGIPRWKMAMSARDPNVLWLVFAKSADNFVKSADGGLTWTATDPDALTLASFLDFHVSMWMDDSERLHVAYPEYSASLGFGVAYRRVSPPGQTLADFSAPARILSNAPATPSTSVTARGSDVFIFTRAGVNASENIRYFRSRDGGATWSEAGHVDSLNKNVRMGSVTYAGEPAVVAWIQDFPSTGINQYRYYRWDGTAFRSPADAVIAQGGHNRFFTIAVVADQTLHVVFSTVDGKLEHRWKDWNQGQGAWGSAVVANLGGTTTYCVEAYPHLVVHGTDLYVVWSQLLSGTTAKTVYWSSWDAETRQWSAAVRLTASSNNCKQCNAPRIVPGASSFIPIVWTEGTASPYRIYCTTIPVTPQTSVPTRRDLDRRIISFEKGETGAAQVLDDCDAYQKGK